MRKKLLPILLTVLMLSLLLVPAVGAQPPIRVIIDGEEKYFDPAPRCRLQHNVAWCKQNS